MHSTETALFRVTNDLLMQADAVDFSVLVLLDLSTAFDTVEHSVLIESLRQRAGASRIMLTWFSYYLSNRTFSHVLSVENGSCGSPQGSVLGPFHCICSPLVHLIRTFKDVPYHFYADDIQLYIFFIPENF